MEAVRASIEKVLRGQVDERATIHDGFSATARPLSPFLESAFDLYSASAAESNFVVATVVDENDLHGIGKRLDALQQVINVPIVLHASTIPASIRRELIVKRQGFIAANGDLYLPHLALILAADSDGTIALPGDFTPSEQCVFLYCLYCEEPTITQDAAQAQLGLSPASVSRALSALCNRKLLDYEIGGLTGRRKSYTIPDKKRYYSEGIRLFGNPIANRYLASLAAYDKQPLLSGIAALSALSDLTKPSRAVYAVSREESRKINDAELHANGHAKNCEIQVLRYDPRPLSAMVWRTMGCADPITMILAIDESSRDERVSIAIRKVMAERGYTWYTD